MCLVIFSANGGLVIGSILLGLDGGIHGRGINLVLDTREREFSAHGNGYQEKVPRCIILNIDLADVTEIQNKSGSKKGDVYFPFCNSPGVNSLGPK